MDPNVLFLIFVSYLRESGEKAWEEIYYEGYEASNHPKLLNFNFTFFKLFQENLSEELKGAFKMFDSDKDGIH